MTEGTFNNTGHVITTICGELQNLSVKILLELAMMKKSNDWSFLYKQKPFLSLVFNKPIAMATAHTSAQK